MNKPDVTEELASGNVSAPVSGSVLRSKSKRVLFWTVAYPLAMVWGIASVVKDLAALVEELSDKLGYWLDSE